MIALSKITMAFTVLLALTWMCMHSSRSDASHSSPDRKPVAQDVVEPIKGGETSRQEGVGIGPQPIEAPAPGVPIDRRTYRELKERAKEH